MLKTTLKRILAYQANDETASVRNFINSRRTLDKPYCPDWEGDLIWAIIDRAKYSRCLEIGFGTGSTALYMLSATEKHEGVVVSIDASPTSFNEIGKENLLAYSDKDRHTLFEEKSEKVLPRFFSDNLTFDFIYIDGWKTFDHLAMEIFFANRMLKTGGTIMFDDSRMNSVSKTITLLQTHYAYSEIDYAAYNETWKLRLWHILTTQSLRRSYRAFVKTLSFENQPAAIDYRYFCRF